MDPAGRASIALSQRGCGRLQLCARACFRAATPSWSRTSSSKRPKMAAANASAVSVPRPGRSTPHVSSRAPLRSPGPEVAQFSTGFAQT